MAVVRTLACIAALAVAATGSSLAAPKTPDAAMMAPINAVANALNSGNTSAVMRAYSESPVVIDEFAPYEWKGAASPITWLNGWAAFAKQQNITGAHATLQAVKNFDSSANGAYIVVPVVFTGEMNGKPFRELGLWTFVLTKRASKWLITAESWATQSMSM